MKIVALYGEQRAKFAVYWRSCESLILKTKTEENKIKIVPITV